MRITDDSFKRLVLTRARNRAKNSGIEFDISLDDIVQNTKCPIFGVELLPSQTRGKGVPNSVSLSLDRIDNKRGYVRGNVRTISTHANRMKNQMTKEECEMLLKNWDAI